ncbi:hypothetical protein GCM10010520_56830 [Rhizobium viscosum]|uniref:Uncharacterized protein n=1 Tax=Rhizobium viscosum TaxID=1673 RepID=A0ABR9IVW8_RHIVS|nr:hypothetical protein [Rhizobium viscosum]MBE1507341.1 hypothetical protein [Rhizobium viscosum]
MTILGSIQLAELASSKAHRIFPDIAVRDDAQASVEMNFILYVGRSKASHKTYAYHFVLIVAQTEKELVLEKIQAGMDILPAGRWTRFWD